MAEKVLKGCNCCKTSNRKVKKMGMRARIAYCTNCHATTVWDLLPAEQADAYSNDLTKRQAFMESLINDCASL